MTNTTTPTAGALESFFVALAFVMTMTACDGPVGPQGPPGDGGSEGPPGPQGPSGLVDIQMVEGRETVEASDQRDDVSVTVECPDGYTVIGGGAGLAYSVGNSNWKMENNRPVQAGSGVFENDGWIAKFGTVDGEDFDGTFSFIARAICALVEDG